MTTLSREPVTSSWPTWRVVLSLTEMWASLAITVMWLAVLFTAIYGPNIETSSSGGSDRSTIPSAVVVALFAFLATWVVAKYAYRRNVEHKE
jgi:multisubunit Na+/H+ antiporter MnhF subunit